MARTLRSEDNTTKEVEISNLKEGIKDCIFGVSFKGGKIDIDALIG